jgi:hypothetical protein
MSQCPSCGGVIGRDCFNPIECADISNSMNSYDIQALEYQIQILKQTLIENNIPIPDLEIKQQSQNDNYCFTDGLPF